MEKFDLHIHSTCSDGKKTVKEIIEYAIANNFKFISITDHDNIDSIEKIKSCDLGNLCYIPGVEISTTFSGYNIHVLCYNFKTSDAIRELIEKQKKVRAFKFVELTNQLRDNYNIYIPAEDLEETSKKSNVGKNDIADLLLKYNYVETRIEAFDKYINNLSYKKIKKVDFYEVYEASQKDGGTLILAHPYDILERNNLTKEELFDLMDKLMKIGCEGIEAYHGECEYEICEELKEYANNKDLLISAGSDYHRDGDIHQGIGCLYKFIDKEHNINIKDITLLIKQGHII